MHERLLDIFLAAIRAVDPCLSVARHLHRTGSLLSVGERQVDLDRYRRILVVGAGKATAAMAAAVEHLALAGIERGLVIVKDGHLRTLRAIEQVEASHPVPDERGLAGTSRLMAMLREAEADTLVICLLSGGASSLMVAPAGTLSLKDLIVTNELLLSSGAEVTAMNTVRKHLSLVKGGRLAELAFPASVMSLIVSDVIGDRLDVIASGPTVPDPTTYDDALAVLRRAGLLRWVPRAVTEHLKRGARGVIPETPKGGEPAFAVTSNHIVCSNHLALQAALARATELGFDVELLEGVLEGEARSAARSLAASAIARQKAVRPGGRPLCLVAGGETTVSLRGRGSGGRNQEFALAVAMEIAGRTGVTCLCGGTDGTDGPTDAAGAIVDGNSVPRAVAAGIHPRPHLDSNDSYGFFERLALADARAARHLKTGPTGTNVMDLAVMAISSGGGGHGVG